jgi:hypothetical protein
MTLSIKEQEEFLRLSQSSSLKADMRYIAAHRHNPLLVDGTVDLDRLIAFLTEYNEFINHQPKPFKPMIDKIMIF